MPRWPPAARSTRRISKSVSIPTAPLRWASRATWRQGFGFYSGGASGSGTVVCYQGLVVRDGATGKDVASPMGENDLGIVPDADTFARERYKHISARKLDLGKISSGGAGALSPAQKQTFLEVCRELYRDKVRNELWKMELR